MRCGMAQVGQNPQLAAAFLAGQLQRLSGIMRHSKGHDLQVSQMDDFRVLGNSEQALQVGRRNGFVSALAHPNRYAVPQGQRSGAANMVAVLVRDKNGVNVVGRQIGTGQPVCELLQPKTAINKQP